MWHKEGHRQYRTKEQEMSEMSAREEIQAMAREEWEESHPESSSSTEEEEAGLAYLPDHLVMPMRKFCDAATNYRRYANDLISNTQRDLHTMTCGFLPNSYSTQRFHEVMAEHEKMRLLSEVLAPLMETDEDRAAVERTSARALRGEDLLVLPLSRKH